MHSNEVVAIKKMSYSGKQTNEVTKQYFLVNKRPQSHRRKVFFLKFIQSVILFFLLIPDSVLC